MLYREIIAVLITEFCVRGNIDICSDKTGIVLCVFIPIPIPIPNMQLTCPQTHLSHINLSFHLPPNNSLYCQMLRGLWRP